MDGADRKCSYQPTDRDWSEPPGSNPADGHTFITGRNRIVGTRGDPFKPMDDGEMPPHDWWRRNIEEFRDHGLPPYRPPRFADGALVPPVVDDLERELGLTVRIRVVDPQDGNEWEVLVGGERVGSVDRRRHADGYPVIGLTSAEFSALVRDAG